MITIPIRNFIPLALASTLLTACGGGVSSLDEVPTNPDPVPTPTPRELIAFEPNGQLNANIKWTDFGVPHITSNTLQSLAFGSGYAYSRDNICILADQIVKVRSERSYYFGPDSVQSSGDNAHLLSDFGYKALRVMESAEKLYPTLSKNSRALIEGYVAGYNKYLRDVGTHDLAPECAGEPWVKPITHADLTAYIFSVSQLSSGLRFFETAFYANPGDHDEYLPSLTAAGTSNVKTKATPIKAQFRTQLPNMNNRHLGSNAWGLGSDKTENGKGILLADPHFPHTGSLKFWQSHITIPGVLDVAGAGLQGLPGIVNIGFNENIAWSHTVSKSQRFVVFKLALNPGNNMEYVVDTEIKPIEKKTFTIDVNMNGNIVPMSKDYFYSHHGLMVETQPSMELLTWDSQWAYTLKDSAAENLQMLDHWLALNLASNLTEFQTAFQDYNGIPWVNTVYSDKEGNAFYIDKSRVPAFSDSALQQIQNQPAIAQTKENLGFYILPGYNVEFEPRGFNPYQQAPQLSRRDFVQNSNDSYGMSNPEAPLSDYSVMYGKHDMPLSLRTRMSLKMLQDSAGNDGKFNLEEVTSALLSNRSYLAEDMLPEILHACRLQGATPVEVVNTKIAINESCTVLANWDGKFNQSSVGAHIFREFAYPFSQTEVYQQKVVLNADIESDALHRSIIGSLAIATQNIVNAGIAPDAPLGSIQFAEKTMADGANSGIRYPWAGTSEITGGFNIFAHERGDQTLYPIHQYPSGYDFITGAPLPSGLSTQGYHLSSGSSWMMAVEFNDNGVSAKGLLLSSQSANSKSPHFDDQTRFYSENRGLREIYFKESDINNHIIEELTITHQ